MHWICRPAFWGNPAFVETMFFVQHVVCGIMAKISCGETAWPCTGGMDTAGFGHPLLVCNFHLWFWHLCLSMGKTHILFAQREVGRPLSVPPCLKEGANLSSAEKVSHQNLSHSILEKFGKDCRLPTSVLVWDYCPTGQHPILSICKKQCPASRDDMRINIGNSCSRICFLQQNSARRLWCPEAVVDTIWCQWMKQSGLRFVCP